MRGKSHGALGIRNIAMEVIPLVFMVVYSSLFRLTGSVIDKVIFEFVQLLQEESSWRLWLKPEEVRRFQQNAKQFEKKKVESGKAGSGKSKVRRDSASRRRRPIL
ncbi:hypothetical protein F5882DRAFT_472188 [Hyaloscypha sp. PMI_1271]|nr:hypothetical protein F5882DRAFT_472188 [Hyaloscypha sp. PMI_1271]